MPFHVSGAEEWASPLRFDFDFPLGRHSPKPVVPGVRLVLFQFGWYCLRCLVFFAMCSSCSSMKMKSVSCRTKWVGVTIVDNWSAHSTMAWFAKRARACCYFVARLILARCEVIEFQSRIAARPNPGGRVLLAKPQNALFSRALAGGLHQRLRLSAQASANFFARRRIVSPTGAKGR